MQIGNYEIDTTLNKATNEKCVEIRRFDAIGFVDSGQFDIKKFEEMVAKFYNENF